MSGVELLPCPLCSRKPKRNGRGGVGGVICSDPHHLFQTYGADQDEADQAWNFAAEATPAQGLDAATIERCAQAWWEREQEICWESGFTPMPWHSAPATARATYRDCATSLLRALNTASTTTRGEDARLREALEEIAAYPANNPRSEGLVAIARAALQGDAAHTSQEP